MVSYPGLLHRVILSAAYLREARQQAESKDLYPISRRLKTFSPEVGAANIRLRGENFPYALG